MLRILVFCRSCLAPVGFTTDNASSRPCPGCAQPISIDLPPPGVTPSKCPACACTGLYVESDFPRAAGWGILLGTIALFLYAVLHWPKWSTLVLLGAAAVDYAVYRALPLRVVCYRCCAELRGFPPNEALKGYDLEIAQKYPEYDAFLKKIRPRRGGPPGSSS